MVEIFFFEKSEIFGSALAPRLTYEKEKKASPIVWLSSFVFVKYFLNILTFWAKRFKIYKEI